jgi:DNA-binding GntR family transcriptional regulator
MGRKPGRLLITWEDVEATQEPAASLDVVDGSAVRLNRRSLDTEDHPIEVVRSLYRGDRVAFEALRDDRD